MKLKQILFTLLLIISLRDSFAQVNFVNNPSFENFKPSGPSCVDKAYYWSAIDSTKICWGGELRSITLGNAPWMLGVGYSMPHSGKSFIRSTQFCTPLSCTPNMERTYPKNRLRDTLTASKTYCVKMFVSLQDITPYAIQELQLFMADPTIDTIKYCMMPLTYLTPQITNTLGIIGDTSKWVEIRNTFTASGNEVYLVLGCFLPDAAITRTATGTMSGNASEYFFDDISIIDFNLPAYAGPDKNINLGDSAFIGRPPEVGLECLWTSGSFTVGTGGGLWVKPTSPGTYSYVVTQDICGNIKTDTVNVNVSPSLISEHTMFSQSIGLSPQPANDILKVTFRNYSDEIITMEILDTNSKTVYSKNEYLKNNSTIIYTDNLSGGIYYLKIKNSKDQFATKKLTVSH